MILRIVRAKPAGQETKATNQMSLSCEISLPVAGAMTPFKIRKVILRLGSDLCNISTNKLRLESPPRAPGEHASVNVST